MLRGQAGKCARHFSSVGQAIPRPRFVIKYPKHIERVGSKERDDLLLSGDIEPIAQNEYRFIGQPASFKCFADLRYLLPALSNPANPKRKMLNGSWIFEHRGKRQRQLEETAEALAYRLKHAAA